MLDPLGALVITFIVMSIVSILGVVLMYLSRNEKLKKAIFYFLAVWGMVIAYCNVLSTPEMWTESIILAWALGALSVVALLIQVCLKKENRFQIARILVTLSVVAGMIDCFII